MKKQRKPSRTGNPAKRQKAPVQDNKGGDTIWKWLRRETDAFFRLFGKLPWP